MTDMAQPTIEIAGRRIGRDQPPYIVAELSGNHNGNLEHARAIIQAAAAAGADAVKLQTYRPDTITLDCDRPDFQITQGAWAGRRLFELYQEAHTPWEWHAPLFACARQAGITIFSTPFDDTAVDLLEALDAPAYKVASFEIVDLPLIERVARTGKPVILSTGMANPEEIGEAIAAARAAGGTTPVLLHCISGYPTPIGETNLRTICELGERFGAVVGLSDHTLGTTAATVAVALGASVIEKHVTMRRADGGPDAAFSLEPSELQQLVTSCRDAFAALGQPCYELQPSERINTRFRRSLYVVADIAAGDSFTPANVRSIRPGFGLPPKHLPAVLGRIAAHRIARGDALDWSMVAGGAPRCIS
jgi:N-acetylneuraminate synthase